MKKIGKYLYSDEEGNLLRICNPDAILRITVEEAPETGKMNNEPLEKDNH